MENFHMLVHFSLLESSPAFVAVHMICCFFLSKNNSTTIMHAGNIVPQAVCFMKGSSTAGYMALAVLTQHCISINTRQCTRMLTNPLAIDILNSYRELKLRNSFETVNSNAVNPTDRTSITWFEYKNL
jgi:hypothetical protein